MRIVPFVLYARVGPRGQGHHTFVVLQIIRSCACPWYRVSHKSPSRCAINAVEVLNMYALSLVIDP